MDDPAKFVENSERIVSFFGGAWPSFHDAEVISMDLYRGDVCPECDSWIGPTLTASIQVLEATQPGAKHADDDTLVTLRFHDVDDLRLIGFNHQNAIIGLRFSTERRAEGVPDYVRVAFQQAHGVDCTFRCSRVEAVNAQPFARTERST